MECRDKSITLRPFLLFLIQKLRKQSIVKNKKSDDQYWGGCPIFGIFNARCAEFLPTTVGISLRQTLQVWFRNATQRIGEFKKTLAFTPKWRNFLFFADRIVCLPVGDMAFL